jgi:LuxR family transcriptional regulator, transcriptional regulator of spore coat protein
MSDHRGRFMIKERRSCPTLTPRELQVLELAANGYSAKEVATMIGIAPRTVEQHVEHVRMKMNARNRVHMVTQAVLHGLLNICEDPDDDRRSGPNGAFKANGLGLDQAEGAANGAAHPEWLE